jgi:4-amino-4-deoxy-L-arabinose transferase-like glycosyltransferase
VSTWAGAARPAPVIARVRALRWPRSNATVLPAVVLIALVLTAHGWNMLHFPYLEDDEGTYFSQGWAVFHLGRLAPYTYFYDHAPIGWMQIGLWQLLTGNSHFGYELASGRVLMLLYQAGSILLVYAIALKVSGRSWVALLAVAVFGLSAYGIYYHRRILLDNVASFWILVSLFLLVGRITLPRVWLSAVALAIAVLSKETAVAVLPAIAVLVARRTPRTSRLFAVSGWLVVAGALISFYPLLALLKGELFPPGSALGSAHPHVSLLCALQFQASRGSDGGILSSSSAFWHAAGGWIYREPLLVIGGTGAALLAVSVLRRRSVVSMIGWMVLSLWLFLGHGGMVSDFYLVPLLPLLALCLALVAGECVSALKELAPAGAARRLSAAAIALIACVCLVSIAVGYERSGTGMFTRDPVDQQVAAVRWVQTHVPPSSNMIIDMYMFAELRYPRAGAPAFPHAEAYWMAADDPAVIRRVLHGDWRQVQYVVTTRQLIYDASVNGFPIVVPALEHSVAIADFKTGDGEVQVRRVDPAVTVKAFATAHRQKALPSCMTAR